MTSKKAQVETYLNTPHIAKILKEYIDPNRQPEYDTDGNKTNPPPFEHGKLIHAAFGNNPHNFVYGANSTYRRDDPGPALDKPLLEKQTMEYQTQVAEYLSNPTPENFSKLGPSTPVEFEKRDDSKIPFCVKK